MKNFKLFAFVLSASFLTACGGGSSIKPVSQKVNGPLGKYFEIVDREYKISGDKLSVEFLRIADGGPEDASLTTHPTFTAELLDEDGNLISSASTDVVHTEDQLEAIFSLGLKESASVTFNFDTTKGAAKFKVSSKWDEKEPTSQGSFDLGGAVDKYPITMHIDIDGNQVKGNYFYNKRGPNAKLNLSGTFEDGEMDLNETDEKGTPTGHFKGEFEDGEYKGQFFDNKGKSMNFFVTEAGASVDDAIAAFEGEVPDDFESLPDIDDEEEISSDDDDDESMDEFIKEYEKFWKSYMSVMKKVSNGDLSAMTEYMKMLNQATRYSEKLNKYEGKMSVKQWEKLNKMNIEMLNEIGKMNQ